MAHNQFSLSGPQLSELDIEGFETRSGFSLPRDYRQFMLSTNGGIPEKNTYSASGVTFHVRKFFILAAAAPPIENLEVQTKLFRSERWAGGVPISFDYGGNMICLGSEGELFGKVLLWTHDSATNPLSLVTGSLSEMMRCLVAEPVMNVGVVEELGRNGTIDEVRALLESGVSLNARDGNGRNLVDEAARYGNMDVLKFCIGSGGDYSESLHYAAMNCQREVVDYLLGLGRDINALNRRGNTPISLVLGNREFKDFLRSRGAS